MKRILCILLSCCMLFLFASCGDSPAGGSGKPDPSSNAGGTPGTVESPQYAACDVDLTALSSTMVYSEVNNMMTYPEDYIGKTVRMRGAFSVYQEEERIYFACLISDATACCAQGIEFVLSGNHSYPADYPEEGAEITVAGVFDMYEEDGYTFCQLIDAQMVR